MRVRRPSRVLLAACAIALVLAAVLLAADPGMQLRVRLTLAETPGVKEYVLDSFYLLERYRPAFAAVPAAEVPPSLPRVEVPEPWTRRGKLYLHRYVTRQSDLIVVLYRVDEDGSATLLARTGKFLG